LGSSQTGNSTNYDRHVYMLDNGTLRFGTYTGQMNVIDTTESFNDGAWHHLVASQGLDGMELWVDGSLRGTNPQTQAQVYDGYWRIGGDTAWGGNSSDWFAGSIDEVAVYPGVLTQQEVREHFQAGGGELPNQLPKASFTHTESGLTVSVDGSGSSDPDGTIPSYAWNWGDSTPGGSGATATHTYGTAGTYTIQLTVTDDRGGTATTSRQLTVTAPPPNQAPTAAFTRSASFLTLSVDGSGSSDPDGTITS
jgi:PKD repeat protein